MRVQTRQRADGLGGCNREEGAGAVPRRARFATLRAARAATHQHGRRALVRAGRRGVGARARKQRQLSR